MTFSRLFTALLGSALILWGGIACAEPIRWSAPMDQYPNKWTPTTPPPDPQPDQNQQPYPQAGYWFGAGNPQAAYAGNAAAQAAYAKYLQDLQAGGQDHPNTPVPGNPYYGYYGQ